LTMSLLQSPLVIVDLHHQIVKDLETFKVLNNELLDLLCGLHYKNSFLFAIFVFYQASIQLVS
jgi:hypothetical protein